MTSVQDLHHRFTSLPQKRSYPRTPNAHRDAAFKELDDIFAVQLRMRLTALEANPSQPRCLRPLYAEPEPDWDWDPGTTPSSAMSMRSWLRLQHEEIVGKEAAAAREGEEEKQITSSSYTSFSDNHGIGAVGEKSSTPSALRKHCGGKVDTDVERRESQARSVQEPTIIEELESQKRIQGNATGIETGKTLERAWCQSPTKRARIESWLNHESTDLTEHESQNQPQDKATALNSGMEHSCSQPPAYRSSTAQLFLDHKSTDFIHLTSQNQSFKDTKSINPRIETERRSHHSPLKRLRTAPSASSAETVPSSPPPDSCITPLATHSANQRRMGESINLAKADPNRPEATPPRRRLPGPAGLQTIGRPYYAQLRAS